MRALHFVSDHGTLVNGRILYRGARYRARHTSRPRPLSCPTACRSRARGGYDSEAIALDATLLMWPVARQPSAGRTKLFHQQGFTRSARRGGAAAGRRAQHCPTQGCALVGVAEKGLPFFAGTLIAISARGSIAKNRPLIAFLLVGGPTPGQFSVCQNDNFDVSDAVLAAKFRASSGAGANFPGCVPRLGSSAAARAIARPGAVVDGPRSSSRSRPRVDNMEGLDATCDGRRRPPC